MSKTDLVIMYHYVRKPQEWTGSVPISPENFKKQVQWAKEHYEIVKPSDMYKETDKPKCIISFDDATKDQFENAFQILKELNVPGYFTIMSGPLVERKVPVFHLVHTVLSHFNDERIWLELKEEIDNIDIETMSEIYSYESNKYRRYVKYIFNFYWEEQQSRVYLQSKIEELYGTLDNFLDQFYISDKEIVEMHVAGMEIGVHCVNHLPYNENAQNFYKTEIAPCKEYLERLLQTNINWYTPAFGGGPKAQQMREQLQPVLMNAGFKGAFTTQKGYAQLNSDDFWHNRIDCNQLILTGV